MEPDICWLLDSILETIGSFLLAQVKAIFDLCRIQISFCVEDIVFVRFFSANSIEDLLIFSLSQRRILLS